MRITTRYKSILIIWFCVLCLALPAAAQQAPKAKYICLFIGDGMGTAQRQAVECYLNATTKNTDPQSNTPKSKSLAMNSLPAFGMTTTHALNTWITDSAAAGTAMACGVKTVNGRIAMDQNGNPVTTIAERAKQQGMKVGIVTSVSIDHATPACFYAHQKKRKYYYPICMDMLDSGFDYFGGGSAQAIKIARKQKLPCPLKLAREKGYRIVTRRDELMTAKPGEKLWAYNHATDSKAALVYEMDRPEDHISLAEFTRRGLELLENPNGFFLMVEGGKIDWACHNNDTAAVIHDTLAFDKAIEEALQFYRRHPRDTLIVVTADHECGGMTIGCRSAGMTFKPEIIAGQKISAEAFLSTVQKFRQQKLPFETALPTIQDLFGLDTLKDSERMRLQNAYQQSVLKGKKPPAPHPQQPIYGGRDSLKFACIQLVSERAGIGWSSSNHTGIPVPTSAIGPGSESFNGLYDNTDIFHKILSVMMAVQPTDPIGELLRTGSANEE